MTTQGSRPAALVTGAASGIGLACAKRLLQDGFQVALTDVDEAGLSNAANPLKRDGAPVAAVAIDVADECSVEAGFQAVEGILGPVAVLISSAGIMLGGRMAAEIADMTLADWQETFRVNATGTFLTAREMLRRRARKPVEAGRIVTLSSVAAQLGGYRGDAAYVASKAAILGFIKIAARQAAPMGITVNAVAAGPVATNMFDRAMDPVAVPRLVECIPLGRIGTPADIADIVGFLASPAASWITGATFDVNGGYRMQ